MRCYPAALRIFAIVLLANWLVVSSLAQNPNSFDARSAELQRAFPASVQSVVQKHCSKCHNEKLSEAEVDLSQWSRWELVSKQTRTLQRVLEQFQTQQMPPPEEPQPTDQDRQKLMHWIQSWLTLQAEKYAGDPGPVILRRLNNAEYTNTIRDLTGLAEIEPTKEFPADSAAGEGFSNTGAALVMSPSLVRKYLDAAKSIAEHVVLLPDGITFAKEPSRADMTNATLEAIRRFYAPFSDQAGGATVNLQGIVFETNQGGRLPVERYLVGTLSVRELLKANAQPTPQQVSDAIDAISKSQQLNTKYLSTLWKQLHDPEAKGLLATLQKRWNATRVDAPGLLIGEVLSWQKALWKFSSVGHIGKRDGPKAWQEPVNPIRNEQELRLAIPKDLPNQDAQNQGLGRGDVTMYLQVSDAGDGNQDDAVILRNPRLVAPGRPDVPLRGLDALVQTLETKQKIWVEQTQPILVALDDWIEDPKGRSLESLASEIAVPPALLKAWASTLGLSDHSDAAAANPDRQRLMNKAQSMSDYAFVTGWVAQDALSIIANSSDQHVRIPGNMPPKSIAVHPSPSRGICTSWKALGPMMIDCQATVRHAHTECGNGIAWRLELRRGSLYQVLSSGFSAGAKDVPIGPHQSLRVRSGDELVLVIEPRDANHSCDLTTIDMTISAAATATDPEQRWNLSEDLHANILEGNPHADSKGNPGVWEFFTQTALGNRAVNSTGLIPPESLLAKWFNEPDPAMRKQMVGALQKLLVDSSALPLQSPDGVLVSRLLGATGPFFSAAIQKDLRIQQSADPSPRLGSESVRYGWSDQMFGIEVAGSKLSENEALVRAPKVLEIKLPANIAAGAELVATALLHPVAGSNGSVQVALSMDKPDQGSSPIPKTDEVAKDPNWTNVSRQLLVSSPVLVSPSGQAQARTLESFDRFRKLFPIALCYTKIVPVDEVVTLTLFYREDQMLRDLMLEDTQVQELQRLWDQLHYVSQDALKSVDAYEQLWQFATQDADPSAFEPLREPIQRKAAEFRQMLLDSQPKHLESLLSFAQRAYRQRLTDQQRKTLVTLYEDLIAKETPHEDALRLLVARVLVSPEFLYRVERPAEGTDKPTDVNDLELANRLSYFLWASMPDATLMDLAASNRLSDPDTLVAQVRRMLKDPKAQRMAVEFGTMWLHIRDLDVLDEKSESHFPEFASIRSDLYQEAILLFTDALANDRSVIDLLSGDYTFLNGRLANYYGIPDVGPADSVHPWRKVEGVRKHGRGGILTLGATLAKQSGASRTSPILRGNWLCEVVLGEKLPKPPKNVPVLAELPPEGVTERQLTELHSNNPACSKCHQRIDPYGFALENYDAIGRFRQKDAAGNPIDASTQLPGGQLIANFDDLRAYLERERKEDFVRQFNRKLFGYALGRSVQLSDEPILKEILDRQRAGGWSIQETICQIVLSKPFRQIRGKDFQDESLQQ